MKSSVIIKGNKYGFQIVLNPSLPFEELNRKVSRKEYEQAVDHVIARGIENCMIQEGDVAVQSFIPAFDGEGVLPE